MALLGLGLPLLSACAAGTSPATFDLTAPSKVAGRPAHGQLVVAVPNASPPLDGDRIVVRTDPQALAFQKDAQWTDALPELVQSRLIQTFENGHLLRSVGYPGQGISADVVLNTEIRRFEIDSESDLAIVEIAGKLINSSGRVVAAQIFSAQAPGSAADGASASAALDQAFGEVTQQIVAWAASKL